MGLCCCDRKGCDTVSSENYFPEVGYVCNKCKDEFVDEVVNSGRNKITEKKFHKYLKAFMATEKGDFSIMKKKNKIKEKKEEVRFYF